MRGLSAKGTVPDPKSQRGYLLITVVVALFLIASVAMLLNYDSAISANASSGELEAARARYVAEAGMQHALWRAEKNACMGDITISAAPLGSDNYTATVTGAAAGSTYILTADQDAWIRSDDVTRNNGTSTSNHVKFQLGIVEQVLTRFDLSSLPANAQITSATAWFHLKDLKNHPEGAITIHEITSDWTETAVTWDTFAGAYRNERLGMVPAQDVGDVWVAINLTGQVQAWVNGQPNFGILFDTQAEGIHTEYTAREDGNDPPRLEVVVGSGPASPVTIQATGTLAGGVTRTLHRPVAAAYQPPAAVTLQLGTDPGGDAMLDSFYPRNYGGQDFVQVNEDPSWYQRPLFRFGLGGVPARAKVLSAKLELRLRNIVVPGNATVHRVTRSWVEGTKSGTGTSDGADWDTYDGTSSWTTAGGDFDATAVADAKVTSTDTWINWEIGPLVEDWLAGEANNGLMIKSDGVLQEAEFYSREEVDATLRPKLTIIYACECGNACMAPLGSGKVLMIVGDEVNPSPDDLAARSMMESWGYTVTFLDDNAGQTGLDSETAVSDLVYIADSVSSSTIGLKLTNLDKGIVNQKGNHNLELEIADGKGSPVGNAVNVADTNHDITRPFAAGPLSIYSADMELLTMPATVAAGVQTLADVAGIGSLVVMDTGAIDLSGNPIAGRRVVLPLGREESFNWNYLNGNGRLLVQRSLAWAVMPPDTGSPKRLLFVVGNDASLTTEELAHRKLIEGWGYVVEIIDDDASQADFNTAAANNDAAYATNDITASRLSTKLVDATIGVITSEDNLSDEFGLSSSIGWDSGTVVEINDNTHYITSPFATGLLTIFSESESLAYVTGTLSPDLGQLASSSSGYGIVTLDAGATMFGGGSAAGRRVQLPWGGSPSLAPKDLNADGLTILKRAIEWGANVPSGGKNILLVVGDPANLTSEQTDKKLLMEGWGHSVTLIATSEDQAAFDTAAASVDVVYVPELGTTPMNELDTKADNLTKGVMTEEARRTLMLGSFSLLPFVDTDSINITDNTHYITETLSIGNVQLSTAVQSMWVLTGTLADDLHVLGELSGTDPALAYLDAGELRNDSTPAPARRVKLPWGAYNFNVNLLTNDALEIMKRAIEWGAEAGSGPIAHWKLDETSGTTAVDSVGGHDGTLTNGPAWVAGQIDGALDFDGSNDLVSIPHHAIFTQVPMTVSAWFKLNTLPTTR
ncbi:MAG: DNRLRE domain-containing protein, partial [Gammaproteobacteria bacterium]|nr:DNRLRE domain-containing protein [Gammaproteobacteria bacterium]